MMLPSTFSTVSPCANDAAVAAPAAFGGEIAVARKVIKVLVNPVNAVLTAYAFAYEPEAVKVLQLNGVEPSVRAPLPAEPTHMKPPGDTIEPATVEITTVAWRITRLTGELKGFHTPMTGRELAAPALVAIELAFAKAVLDIPNEYMLPR